jgi:hypothetical protein
MNRLPSAKTAKRPALEPLTGGVEWSVEGKVPIRGNCPGLAAIYGYCLNIDILSPLHVEVRLVV